MYDDILKNCSESLTNVTDALQLQTEPAYQSLNNLSTSMQESIYNISTRLDQIIAPDWSGQLSASYDYMSQVQALTPDWMDRLSAVYDSISHVPALTSGWIDQISEICNSISQTIELSPTSFDNLSFLRTIDFQEEYIDLTDEECDSINTILQSPDTFDDAPPKVSKGRIAVSDFIKTILFPLFLAILQMLHTSYYNKLDAIEAQKTYIEEHQLQEEEIQLLKEQVQLQEQQIQVITDYTVFLENTLNELIGYANSQEYLQETQEPDSDIPNHPMPFDEDLESPDGVPHYSPKAPNCSDTTADESDNP